MPSRRPRIPVDDDLAYAFTRGAHAAGIGSSFAPLVNIAMSGGGGGREPEARITERLFQWANGMHRDFPEGGSVGRVRAIWRRMKDLPGRDLDVLYLAYGPEDWPKHIDAVFGRGTGRVVESELGDLVGVALVTTAAHVGYVRSRIDPEPGELVVPQRRAVCRETGRIVERRVDAYRRSDAPTQRLDIWDREGGWIVRVCKVGDAKRIEAVRTDAVQRFRDAYAAWRPDAPAAATARRRVAREATMPEPIYPSSVRK